MEAKTNGLDLMEANTNGFDPMEAMPKLTTIGTDLEPNDNGSALIGQMRTWVGGWAKVRFFISPVVITLLLTTTK